MRSFLRCYGPSIATGALLAGLLISFAAGPRLYHRATAFATAVFLAPPSTIQPLPHAPVTVSTVAAELIGGLDTPAQESLTGHTLEFAGWAFDPVGLRAVEIRFPNETYTATLNIPRDDVRNALPQHIGIEHSGFEARIALPDSFSSLDRQPIEIIAINRDGKTKSLGKRSWLPASERFSAQGKRPFYLLMMTSGLPFGGGGEIDTAYRNYISPTIRTGVSVPILYMRTTKGAKNDWVFDPAFDLTRRCDDRLAAEDNLDGAIAYAIEKKTPIQFILNGGIWSNASCTTSEWDLSDHLEEDPALCQWAQDNMVYPSDHLSHLPGSTASPRLARSLTYHVYAEKVRAYKKRNLQAAARHIAAFAKKHPDLFAGITLDADTYMNPFFSGHATFDYNPGMLRQFREWLQGTGAYAGKSVDSSIPDLSVWRRAQTLTLDEVNAIAGHHWQHWDDVDPPRPSPEWMTHLNSAPTIEHVWENPWWHLWDAFRKHIVHLHYTELAHWVAKAGIPEDRIFSAQGFAASVASTFPSVYIEGKKPFSYHESAGVSIEGSKPRNGSHLGAIVYDKPARNDVAMPYGHSLFSEFARVDDGWGIVEYNAADIGDARTPPQYHNAYLTYRDAYNFDAQRISHMAWNGSNGLFADDPAYVSYTSFRNTGTEEAMRDFMVSRAFFPESLRLWTFGSAHYASDDGWTISAGRLQAQTGALALTANHQKIELLSPADQVLRTPRLKTLRLIVPEKSSAAVAQLTVAAQDTPNADWQTLSSVKEPKAVPFVNGFVRFDVPLQWPESWIEKNVIAERLRLDVELHAPEETLTIHRIALNP
ncbi:MAG: hypothetical protein LBE15_05870 [Burkholderiales bacterium]|jgi:hypothetical protein|nr:hypothetical protein [Burkholderiales bacterium]